MSIGQRATSNIAPELETFLGKADGYHQDRELTPGRKVLSIGFQRTPGMDDQKLAELAPLLKQSTQPVELNLNGSRVTDAGLAVLVDVDTIVSLGLGDGVKISDAGLKHVGAMKNLEEIYLTGDLITDAGIAHLAKLKSMRKLSAYLSKLTADAFAHVADMTQLEELVLGSGRGELDDSKLAHMKGLVNLKELSLEGEKVTDAGMANLRSMVGLKKLRLETPNVTAAGAAHLAALANLEELVVLKCPGLDGAGLAAIKNLKNLQTLELIYTEPVDSQNSSVLSTLPKLTKLRLGKVDKDGLAGLKNVGTLKDLDLNFSRLEDDNLAHIAGLKNLEKLDVQQTSVTDAGMKHLAGLTGLQELWIQDNAITDEGLKSLVGLTKLQRLFTGNCKVTGSAFGSMKRLEALTELWLGGNPVVDDHVITIKDLPALKEVNLTGTKVSEEAAENLKRARPALRVRDVTGNDVTLTAPPQRTRPPQEDLADAKPEFTMTSIEYGKQFAADAQAARAKYTGKVVELTGKITMINRNSDGPMVSLEGGGLLGVVCFTAEESPWAKAVPGQTVTIKGKGSPYGEGLVYALFTNAGQYAGMTTTAVELAKEFDADPEATGKKYKDKYVMLSGEVESKEYNSAGAVSIRLKTPGSKVKVAVSFTAFENELTRQIKPGKPLKVVGQYTLNFGEEEVVLRFCMPVQ